MLYWRAPRCRAPIIAEVSKPANREPSAVVVMPPPLATASRPSSLSAATQAASGLVAYDCWCQGICPACAPVPGPRNIVVDDQEGERHYWFFIWCCLLLLTCHYKKYDILCHFYLWWCKICHKITTFMMNFMGTFWSMMIKSSSLNFLWIRHKLTHHKNMTFLCDNKT
jgi:hypothetical protein